MPRAFPVPGYFRTTNVSGADKRAINSGTGTESTATLGRPSNTLADQVGYLRPEQAAVNVALAPVGTARGYGWAYAISTLISADSLTIAAGNITIPIHYSRAGGLLTSNITCRFQGIAFIANSTLTSFTEIGRGAVPAAVTVTTTEASTNYTVPISAASALSTDYLYIEIYTETDNALTGDTPRIHTDSATATRLSAVPDYTVQYTRALSDSTPATDVVTRQASYARSLSDSASVTDTLTRSVNRPRALSDSAPATDSLARQASYNRTLADSAPAVDTLTRQAVYSRSLADNAPVTDALARQASYTRALSDSAGNVTDTLTRVVTANRALSDSAGVTDSLTRQASYNRSLSDSAAVVDSLARRMIYARSLMDNLSEGGGTTIYPIFAVLD